MKRMKGTLVHNKGFKASNDLDKTINDFIESEKPKWVWNDETNYELAKLYSGVSPTAIQKYFMNKYNKQPSRDFIAAQVKRLGLIKKVS